VNASPTTLERPRSRLATALGLMVTLLAALGLSSFATADWVVDRAAAHAAAWRALGFPLDRHPFSTLASPGAYAPPGLWTDLVADRVARFHHPLPPGLLKLSIWLACLVLAGWSLTSAGRIGVAPWILACAPLFEWNREFAPWGLFLGLLALNAGRCKVPFQRNALTAMVVLAAPGLCREWPLVWLLAGMVTWLSGEGATRVRATGLVAVFLPAGLLAGLLRSYRETLHAIPWECHPLRVITATAWRSELSPLSGVQDTLLQVPGPAAWLPWLVLLAGVVFTLEGATPGRSGSSRSPQKIWILLVGMALVGTWCALAPPVAPTLWLLSLCGTAVLLGVNTQVRSIPLRRPWRQPVGWALVVLVLATRFGPGLVRMVFPDPEGPAPGDRFARLTAPVSTRGSALTAALRTIPALPADWELPDGTLAPAWVLAGLGPVASIGPDLEWYGDPAVDRWAGGCKAMAEPGWWRGTCSGVVLSHPDPVLPERWLEAALAAEFQAPESASHALVSLAAGIPVLAPRVPGTTPLADRQVLEGPPTKAAYAFQESAAWLDWVEASDRAAGPRRRAKVLAFQAGSLWGHLVAALPGGAGAAFPAPAAALARSLADNPVPLIPGDPVNLAALQLAKRAGWVAVDWATARGNDPGPAWQTLGKALLLELSTETVRRHAPGLRLIATLRHVQAVHALRRAAGLGSREATLILGRHLLENGQLDAGLACLEQAARPGALPWAGKGPGNAELLRAIGNLRSRVGNALADHALKVREFPENPVRQAALALEAGLVETALALLEKSPVTLLGAEGARMELELMALLGRTESLSRLIASTRPEDLDRFLGTVTLETGSGPLSLPAGAWYTTLDLASRGLSAQAADRLDAMATALGAESVASGARTGRAIPLILGWGLGIDLPPARWSLPAVLSELEKVSRVEEARGAVANFVLDLEAAAFYLELGLPDPSRARGRLARLADQASRGGTDSAQWLSEYSLFWGGAAGDR